MIWIIQETFQEYPVLCHAVVTEARHIDPAACNVMLDFYSILAVSVTPIVLLDQRAEKPKVSLVVFTAIFVVIGTSTLLPFTQISSKLGDNDPVLD
jgi:hypothetical protein